MLSSLTLTFAALPGTLAWGTLGHTTVAYLAQSYVSDSTASWAKSILSDNSTSYLANIATWADSYRYTDEGEFTAPLHYIDAEDDPPNQCGVDFERDCSEEGCIVSAIANYTQRAQASSSELDAEQINYALRFLVHFLGDIQQPLHCEAFAIGGNDVDVTYNGEETNLHHIWDTEMPEQLRGGYNLSDAKAWADDLKEDIDGGKYADQAEEWLDGLDVQDPKASALVWARDANSYVCSVVMPDGAEPLESDDLSGEYYDSAIGTIEMQIAKGGYRLAAWLDAIAEAGGGKGGYGGVREEVRDLDGREFLPVKREDGVLSEAKIRRRERGWECKH